MGKLPPPPSHYNVHAYEFTQVSSQRNHFLALFPRIDSVHQTKTYFDAYLIKLRLVQEDPFRGSTTQWLESYVFFSSIIENTKERRRVIFLY